VTTLEKVDLPIVVKAMSSVGSMLTTAGVMPPSSLLQRFSSYFPPGTPFSYILIRLNEISQLHPRFHICGLKDQVEIADAIHSVENLTIDDRLVLSNAPASMRIKPLQKLIQECATCVANQRGGNILDIPSLKLDLLDKEVVGDRAYLYELETLHKGVIVYLWLSFRFPGIFTTRPLATHIKEIIEGNIEHTLKLLSFDEKKRQHDRRKLREAAILSELRQDLLISNAEENDGDSIADDLTPGENGEQISSKVLKIRKILHGRGPSNVQTDANVVKGPETRDNQGKYLEDEIDGNGVSELRGKTTAERIFEDGSSETTTFSDTEDAIELGSSDSFEGSNFAHSSPSGKPLHSEAQMPEKTSKEELPTTKATPYPGERPRSSRTDSVNFEDEKAAPTKPSLALPFEAIQPSSSDELAKLISARQRQ
jgi:hypothetical protein